MKAVKFLIGILKAAILLLFLVNVAFAQQKAFYETKRKPEKKVYKCKDVGVQKVGSAKSIRAAKKGKTLFAVTMQNEQVIPDTVKEMVQEVSVELYAWTVSTELHKVEKELKETHTIPMPKPVYFKFDTDELTYEDLHQIALAIEHLKLGKSIILEGHTDSHGSHAYNRTLSLKRANKIKKMIVELGGVNESAISIKHYGEEKPAVENNSAENRQLNRRVEFIVL